MKTCIVMVSVAIALTAVGNALADEPTQNVSSGNVYLRPIAGIGYTSISNDAKATYDGTVASGIDRLSVNGAFGAQILTDITPRLKFGVEASFTHWINETTSLNNHPLSPSGEEYCYHTVNTLALMEVKFSERFFVQAGSGLSTSIKPNNRYTGTTPYFMIAPGMNIKISDHAVIPVMLRLSSLESGKGNYGGGEGFGSILPVTVVTGVTLKY